MQEEIKPVTVKDVPAEQFIKAYAAHLKQGGKIELPEWVDLVKTGAYKELAPYDQDWYYIRAAALARKVYFRQSQGVGALSKKYGGRNKAKRGCMKEHRAFAARGLIRHCFQQLEKMNLVTKDEETLKGGRIVTSIGRRDMDLIAGRCEVKFSV